MKFSLAFSLSAVIVFTEKSVLTAIASLRDMMRIMCGNDSCYTGHAIF
jgi:hypothetical protein